MNKKIILILLIGFIWGIIHGIAFIEDLTMEINSSIVFVYPLLLLFMLIYIKIKFISKEINNHIFPMFNLVLYIPVNILAGINLGENVNISYYASYPRYGVILLYAFALIILYSIAYMFDTMFKYQRSKLIYTIFDVLSLTALPVLLFATYFVSPH